MGFSLFFKRSLASCIAPIDMKLPTRVVSTTPNTMNVFVLRENDVIRRTHPFSHLEHEKSRCSGFARNWCLCGLNIESNICCIVFKEF